MRRIQSAPLAMTDTDTCPCKSDRPYAACCAPLLSGDRIACTAEALMRSRYVAYVLRDVVYILRTWHPSTRPDTINPAAIPEWNSLQIIRTEKGRESDSKGIVEFKATSFSPKHPLLLHEVSRFVHEDGQWFYVDGDLKDDALPAERRAPKIGRNDPCHCGSGKKSKRCCGR